ncbi:helix-turn-helix transcriptional regulator [Pectobacterium betavasculorum]|uniref:helix-turn-helix transcriptional regulator n=1 Tax=Pectobacterium betavasculorum TaxID=55207 RepID=UPI00068A2596|nr:AlpA family phage regulatory protein [Pectobacterium betavasculorum]
MNQPCTRLIRLSEVMKKTGFGKAWIYRLISQNRFPQPVRIGIRAAVSVKTVGTLS